MKPRYHTLIRGPEEDAAAAAAAAAAASTQQPPPPPPYDYEVSSSGSNEGVEPSCADVCCLPRGADVVQQMDNWQSVTLLTLTQTGVVSVVAFQAALHLVWIMLDLVPGFALYDGPVGSISAYTHTGWWMFIDLIVLLVGSVSVYFGLSYVPAENVIERGLARNENWIIMYMVMLGIGMISLVMHVILSFFEVASCNSTLCLNNYWVLIFFIVGLIIDAVALGWGISRAYSFRTTLKNVMVKWNVLLVVETPPPLPPTANARIGNKHTHQFKGQAKIPRQYKMK